MSQQKATDYIRELTQLMLSVEVTDRDGRSNGLDEGTEMAIQMMLSVRSASQKMLLTGNGGSAALVSHIQNDLCKTLGIRALVFTEQPLLTALANDDGYGSVFERPVELWADPGDLLLTISSSGQSENILRGARASLERGCKMITLTGFKPNNPLRQMGDLNFYVGSGSYGYVETAHAALTHFMTDRAKIFTNAPAPPSVSV